MNVLALIPARYASTRFPGKPLARLGNRTIVQRVFEAVSEVLPDVCVATDDERILQEVRSFGGQAIMTRRDHRSGTDRCLEALQLLQVQEGWVWDVVVNVQGDEPFIASQQLRSVISCFDDPRTQIATLVKPFTSKTPMEEIENPNSPKVVCDAQGFALYFSRSVIPFLRGVPRDEWPDRHTYLKHIGLYAYRANVLEEIAHLPQGDLEQCESLEQLRWLQAGYRIKTRLTDIETIGIDTPDDLRRAEAFLNTIQS